MKIAILSRNGDLYSTRRLREAAEGRNHSVEIIDYLRCYMNITSSKTSVNGAGEILPVYDAIIPRIGAKRTFYGTAIVRQFESGGISTLNSPSTGTFTLNSSIAITRSRDKLRSLQLMAREGIALPKTAFASSPDDIKHLIKIVGGAPLIIKLIEGTQGNGVVLAETTKAAESVIQAMMEINANIIIQEFIKEASGVDVRSFVVGDKIVASMSRHAEPGEFRSNIHQGGNGRPVKITKIEKEMVLKAVKTMGLKLAGVDFLRSERGPLIMEVNSSPGLEGIETTTGCKIAEQVIEYIEKNAKPINKRSRYQG